MAAAGAGRARQSGQPRRTVPARGLALVRDDDRVEAALWYSWRVRQDQEARTQLFDLYAGFAKRVAAHQHRRRPSGQGERQDFEHDAFRGLIEAIDRFDPTRGIAFSSFAFRRIRGAINDGAARSSDSAAVYRASRRMKAERVASLQDGSHADQAGSAFANLVDLVVGLAVTVLIDDAAAQLDRAQTVDYAANPYGGEAVHVLQAQVMREVQRLGEPGRGILTEHYVHGVPFTQIAELRGLSKGRISQIHKAALMQLKDRLRDSGD